MSILKTEAVVLKTQDFRETSKILAVYTRKYGRIQLIAKGVRSQKSKFGAVLDVLNYLNVVFYFKETRELQLLSNADLVEPFLGIRADLHRFASASVVAEIVYRTQLVGNPSGRLFAALISALKGIDQSSAYRNYLSAFLVRFLEISGFKPRLRRCSACGQEPSGNWVFFDVARGAFRCERCAASGGEGYRISVPALRTLQALRDISWSDLTRIQASPMVSVEMERFLLYYLRYHFDGLATIHALDFLNQLTKK